MTREPVEIVLVAAPVLIEAVAVVLLIGIGVVWIAIGAA